MEVLRRTPPREVLVDGRNRLRRLTYPVAEVAARAVADCELQERYQQLRSRPRARRQSEDCMVHALSLTPRRAVRREREDEWRDRGRRKLSRRQSQQHAQGTTRAVQGRWSLGR